MKTLEHLTPFQIHSLPKVGFWKPVLSPNAKPSDPYYDYFSREILSSPFPSVTDFVDETWVGEEREAVVRYLKAGQRVVQYRGMSSCRVCRKFNGSADFSDGFYVWPEGFAHYVEEHSVKPDPEFLAHVLRSRSEG